MFQPDGESVFIPRYLTLYKFTTPLFPKSHNNIKYVLFHRTSQHLANAERGRVESNVIKQSTF